MTTAYASPMIQDAPDGPGVLTQADDGKFMMWDGDKRRMIMASIRMAGGGINVLRGGANVDGAISTAIAAHVAEADPHTGYLLATGARAGASSQAQTFTNGIVGPSWAPAADSTTAMRIYKADGATTMMTFNTTSGRVGIGADVSQSTDNLYVVGTTKVVSAGASVFPAHYVEAITTSGFPAIVVRRARGTALDAPSQVLSGDFLGALEFRGYHSGGAFHSTGTGAIRCYAGEDFTSGAKGGELRFYSTPLGSATMSQRVAINPDGYTGFGVTSPTALVHIAGSSTARASLHVNVGAAPTSPALGDIWYLSGGRLHLYRAADETIPSGVPGSAFTQTFSTADRTIAAYTSDPESSAYTGLDNLQVGTPYAKLTDLNALRVAYETLRVFSEDIGQALNALIDDAQAFGISG